MANGNTNILDNSSENSEQNTGPKTGEVNNPPKTTPNEPVKEIIANVDLTKKPESVKEKINLLNDDELDAGVTASTEGDKKKQETEQKSKPNVDDFRKQTTQIPATGSDGKIFNPTLAEQQAQAWVKIIDMGMRFGLKAWSGQADNVGLEVSEPDKEVLAQQIAIALGEYKVVVPILLTVLTTFGAMYATPIMNARDSKKKIDEFRAQQKAQESLTIPKTKPEFNPATGQHKKGKGRFHKA